VIATELHVLEVEVLTPHQRLTGALSIRGLLGSLLNDPAAASLRLSGVATEPIVGGVPAVHDVPEAVLQKNRLAVVAPVDEEPANSDGMEVRRRYLLAEGQQFTVKGFIEVGAASADSMHAEMLMKNAFFKVVDAVVMIHGEGQEPKKSWGPRPVVYVNTSLVDAIFLG
jgi:hypothetical protein